jgi:hypothetical protein
MLLYFEFILYCMASKCASMLITFLLQCVDQAELEKFDGVSQGKYTIGLGQTKMSFCDDREGETPHPAPHKTTPH